MKLLTHRSNWLLGMLVILAVLLAAGSAPAQNANADQAAGIRDRIRDLMETSRQEWHKGYDAALRADRGGGASAEADKEIAYQAAGAAEEQALMHAEQAGPVAEALYWREKQQTLREQRDRWPAGAPAFDSATDLIDNYGDKAFAKLMEAQRGAATDPEMRQQLHDYYREEAAERRRRADAFREQESDYRRRGEHERADTEKFFADQQDGFANGFDNAAERLGPVNNPPKKKPKEKKKKGSFKKKKLSKAELLKKERGRGKQLGARRKKEILAEMRTLRARQGESSADVDKRRGELLGMYKGVDKGVKKWLEDLDKEIKRLLEEAKNEELAKQREQEERMREMAQRLRRMRERRNQPKGGTTRPARDDEGRSPTDLERLVDGLSENAGAVAQYDYWRIRAYLEGKRAEDFPKDSDERKQHEKQAEDFRKKAEQKLQDARDKAKEDPQTRSDLNEYFGGKASDARFKATLYRNKAEKAEKAGDTDEAKKLRDLARASTIEAGKLQAVSDKYAEPAEEEGDD